MIEIANRGNHILCKRSNPDIKLVKLDITAKYEGNYFAPADMSNSAFTNTLTDCGGHRANQSGELKHTYKPQSTPRVNRG